MFLRGRKKMNIIDDVVKNLRNNPVFHMSLASKELFHSNVLAWLLECQNIDGLADIFAPCDDKGNKLKDFKVLTVLREKSHLDLIIVFLPKKDYDSINDNDLVEIKDLFLNSEQPSNIKLLEQLQNDFRFVVVENKFKSIPNEEQLEKYNNTIKSGICFIDVKEHPEDKKRSKRIFSIVLKEEKKNTTCYLMAPEIALDNFKEYQKCQKCQEFPKYQDCPQYQDCPKWLPLPYEKIWNVLQSKIDDTAKDFTAKFIEHYANFLKDMLQLTKDIEEKLKPTDNPTAFPDWQDISKLKKIRIHDFYEKLWFSVLLNKIQILEEKVPKGNRYIDYSNTCGILNFNFKNTAKKLIYGVQIQQGQFRLFVYPEHKWKTEGPKLHEEIMKYCNSILSNMNEKFKTNWGFSPNRKKTEELHHFGEFKYRYIRLDEIDEKVSIEKLTKMINAAWDAIAIYQLTLDNLEAE